MYNDPLKKKYWTYNGPIMSEDIFRTEFDYSNLAYMAHIKALLHKIISINFKKNYCNASSSPLSSRNYTNIFSFILIKIFQIFFQIAQNFQFCPTVGGGASCSPWNSRIRQNRQKKTRVFFVLKCSADVCGLTFRTCGGSTQVCSFHCLL